MKGIQVNRNVKAGSWPLVEVFPDLEASPAFRAIFSDGLRQEVLRDC